MPIKKPHTADAAPAIKRVQQSGRDGDFATKESLQDHLVLVHVKEFDDKHVGQYGETSKVVVDVVDLDDHGARHDGLWFFSNLAKQIGAGLAPGETGLGRIVSGPTKNGTGQWWGFQFSEDDAEYARAEESVVPF